MESFSNYNFHALLDGFAAFSSLFIANYFYINFKNPGHPAASMSLLEAIKLKDLGQTLENPINKDFLLILALTMGVIVYLTAFGNFLGLTSAECDRLGYLAAAKWSWLPPVTAFISVIVVYNLPILREPIINIVNKIGVYVMKLFGNPAYGMSVFSLECFAYGYYALLGAGIGVAIAIGLVRRDGCTLSEEEKSQKLANI